MVPIPLRVVAVIIAPLVLAAGCAERSQHQMADPFTNAPPMTQRGIRAAAVIVDSAQGRVTVAIDLETHQVELGAYQGALSFDTTALSLVSADPASEGGRFANASGPGVVRFAGFSTTGFQTRRAALVRFTVKDWTGIQRVSVELTTAGTATGERLSGDGLQSSRVIYQGPEVAR